MGITEKQKNKCKEIVIGIIISICTLLVIYLEITIYFTNYFYFGSAINCMNVSGKTVEEVKEQMSTKIQKYTLNLKERGGKTEEITAADIGLKYNSDEEVQNFKDRQYPFEWISALFNTEDSKITIGVSYDEELLKERLDQLSCFDSSNIIEPKNPSFKYTDNSYVIVNEVYGNKVNKDILYDQVVNSILKEETTIDFESINCYVNPQYTFNSPKIIDIKNILNKYVSSKVTYTFGEHKEILDGSIINKWINIDENLGVTFDEKKVEDYLEVLSNTYSTMGKIRDFVTSLGKAIEIGGGDYGWLIDTKKEAQDLITALKEGQTLITALKEGQTITKEPIYMQTALSHGNNDIGNTYVEIDMTKQHLWFYKNGSLIVEGDVVTGNVSDKHSTPIGIYKLKYKQRGAVLTGPGYSAPVTFWMPFNGGIGIHDASWRSEFGENIYKTNGSHGCINAPYYLAQAIFNNIGEGNPVVCYY